MQLFQKDYPLQLQRLTPSEMIAQIVSDGVMLPFAFFICFPALRHQISRLAAHLPSRKIHTPNPAMAIPTINHSDHLTKFPKVLYRSDLLTIAPGKIRPTIAIITPITLKKSTFIVIGFIVIPPIWQLNQWLPFVFLLSLTYSKREINQTRYITERISSIPSSHGAGDGVRLSNIPIEATGSRMATRPRYHAFLVWQNGLPSLALSRKACQRSLSVWCRIHPCSRQNSSHPTEQ